MKFITVQSNNLILKKFHQLVVELEYKYWFDQHRLTGISSSGFKFHNIELIIINDLPVSFSGCSIVNDKLRILQQLYTLPEYRRECRDAVIQKNGFIDRHIETAKKLNMSNLLVTVHEFNNKTKTMQNIWLNKRHKYRHFKDFKYKGIKLINSCNQHWFEKKI